MEREEFRIPPQYRRDRAIIPGQFSSIYQDMRDFDLEFLEKLKDLKCRQLISSFAPFWVEGDGNLQEQEAEEFLRFYQCWKIKKFETTNDPAEKFLVSNVTLGALRHLAKGQCEGLIFALREASEGSYEYVKTQKILKFWMRVGQTVSFAMTISSNQRKFFRNIL